MLTDLENYITQGEPEQKERGYLWHTAIGLQQVDGLKPSDYLIATANENINGDITLDEAYTRIESYYEAKPVITDDESRTEEADKVSTRIAQILSEKTFSFSPPEYIAIHRRLFGGIYKFAGKIRDYNISKNEWVLKGLKTNIFEHLKFQPDITAKALSGLLGVSTRTVERHLKELREKGIIQRVGSDKSGHWEIKN